MSFKKGFLFFSAFILYGLWYSQQSAWASPLVDQINGIWQDGYGDSVGVTDASNVVVSNGVATLSACDGSVTSGEYTTTIIAPAGHSAWGELAVDGIVSASTVTLEVYADDGAPGVTGPALVTGSSFPLDLSAVDADLNPILEISVLFTYVGGTPCPAINELSVTWEPEASLLTAKRAPATVDAGGLFTYTLRLSVSNTDAESLVLWDTLPSLGAGTVIQPVDYGQDDSPVFDNAGQGGQYTATAILIDSDGDSIDDFPIPANSVYWNLGTVAAGETLMFQYTVSVPDKTLADTEYLNTATAESSNAQTSTTNEVSALVTNSVSMVVDKTCSGPVIYTETPDLCRIAPDATVTFQVSTRNRIIGVRYDGTLEPLLGFQMYDDLSEVCAVLAAATPPVADCSTAISAISGGGVFDAAFDHDANAGTATIPAIVWPVDAGPVESATESYAVDFTGVAGGTTFTNTVCGDSSRGSLVCEEQDSEVLTDTPGGIGGKSGSRFKTWGSDQNVSYSLSYRNAGISELNDVIFFDRIPDELDFVTASVSTDANATIFYATTAAFTDPNTPPDYDLGDVLDTVAPSDIDVGANTYWDTTPPADPSTVTWVAVFVPSLSSNFDATPSSPTSVTASITARVIDGDVCSELDILNSALQQVNASTDTLAVRTATGFVLSGLGSTTTTVQPDLPELRFSTSSNVDPDPVVAPGTQTFTLVIVNTGDTAQTVEAVVSWPQIAVNGVLSYPSLVSASGGTLDLTNIATGEVTIADIGPLAAGSSATIEVALGISSGVVDGTTYSLSTTLNATDATCGPVSTSTNTPASISSPVNLTVNKEVSPTLLTPGSEFAYMLTYINPGPGPSTGTYVVDALPDKTVFLNAELDNGESFYCSGPPLDASLPDGLSPASPIDATIIAASFTLGTDTGGGVWTCPFGEETTWVAVLVDDTTLDPDQLGVLGARSFTLNMRNDEDRGAGQVSSPNGTVWTNAPAIFSNELLQAIGNSTVSVISDQAALKVEKTGPGVVGADSEFIWLVDFQNDSTASLTTATLTDVLPAGTSFVSATLTWNDEAVANGMPSGAQVIAPVGSDFLISPAARSGDLQGAEGGTLAITVQVDADLTTGTLVLNTVCANGTDGVGVGTPEVCDTDIVEARNPELELNKLGSPDDPAAGDTLTYTLLFGNRNPIAAPDIVITDTLPVGVTYVASSARVISPLTFTIGEPAISSQVLTWSAANGNALTDTGSGLDTIPASDDLLGDIVIEYQVTIDAGVAAGTDLVNRAAIATSSTEDGVFDSDDCGGTAGPEGFQNADCVTVTTPFPDPAVVKDGDDSGEPGTNISWQITYRNNNNEDALDTYVIDTLPDIDAGTGGDAGADVTYVTDVPPAGVTPYYSAVAGTAPVFDPADPTGSGDWSATPTSPVNHIAWLIGTLSANAGPFTIEVTASLVDPSSGVDVASGQTFTNRVEIFTSSTDDDPTNNEEEHDTVTPGVDMQVEKVGSVEGAVPGIAPGESMTYTVTYTNTGTQTAYGVWIEDTLPVGMTYVSDTFTIVDLATENGGVCTALDTVGDPIASVVPVARVDVAPVHTWYLGGTAPAHQDVGIPVGCTQSFTLEVKLDSSLADLTVLTNVVRLTTDNKVTDPPLDDPDTDPFDCNELYCDNNEDETSVTVFLTDLVVEKSVIDAITGSEEVTSQGSTLTYTIAYDNLGKIGAEGVEISEVIPAGTTYVDGSLTAPPDTTVSFGTDGGGNITDFTLAFNNTLPAPATFTGESLVCDGGGTTGNNCKLSAENGTNATASGNDVDVYGGRLSMNHRVSEHTFWSAVNLNPASPAVNSVTSGTSDDCEAREGVGDVDGDGIPDAVLACRRGDDTTTGEDNGSDTGEVWVVFLNADGTPKGNSYKISSFTEPVLLGTTSLLGEDVASRLGGLDLNGDIAEDQTVIAVIEGTQTLRFLSLNPDGSLKAATSVSTGGISISRLANAGDIDGNGVTDLVASHQSSTMYIFFLNASGGIINSTSFGAPRSAHDVVGVGDVDGNGVADVGLANLSGAGTVFLMNSDGSVASNNSMSGSAGMTGLGDIDGDGVPEFATADWSNTVYAQFLDSDGTGKQVFIFNSSNGMPAGSSSGQRNAFSFVGDLDGDGSLTIYWGTTNASNQRMVELEWSMPDGDLEYLITPTGTLTSWNALTVSDDIPDGTSILYTLGRQAPLGTCVYDLGATWADIDMTANSGYLDISGISAANTNLCLSIDLTTSDPNDLTLTPQLKAWQVSYRTEERPSFTFQVTVDDPYVGPDLIPNTVVISTTTPETDYTNNDDDDEIRVVKTDLAVIKDVDQAAVSLSAVNPGPATLTYTIEYTNNGPDAAENWSLTDILPPQIDPATALFTALDTSLGNPVSCSRTSSAQATNLAADCTVNGLAVTGTAAQLGSSLTDACDGNTNEVWDDPNSVDGSVYMSPAGTAFWQIDLGSETQIDTITIHNGNNAAHDIENRLAGAIVTVLDNSLSVVYTSPALLGIEAPQVLTVGVANGQFVQVDLNNGQRLQLAEVEVFGIPTSATLDQGTCSGSVETDLAVGESGTITITADIDPSTPVNDLLVNNVSIETDTAETDYTNNDDSAQTVIDDVANVYITKTGPSSANLGDTVVFTVGYGNNGNLDAVNVEVIDTLPMGCDYDAAAQALTLPSPNTVVGQVLTWTTLGATPGTLVPEEGGSLNVACTITDSSLVGSSIVNPVVITTTTPELTTTDNEDEHPVPIDVELASLSGSVFHDADQSATHESDEAPISGVTITLIGTDLFGNTVNLTATTDAFGDYSFVGLNPSDGSGYTVTETQPNNWESTASIPGTGATSLGTGDASGIDPASNIVSVVVLSGGEDAIDYDFGEFWPIEIAKTGTTKTNNRDGTWTVTYTLTATNTGNATHTYDIYESIEPAPGITVNTATVAYGGESDGTDGAVTSPFGPGAGTVVENESLATGATESWLVTVLYDVDLMSLQASGSGNWECGDETDAQGGLAFGNVLDTDNPYDDSTNDEGCLPAPVADNGDAPASYGEAIHAIESDLFLGLFVDDDTGSWNDGVDARFNATDDDADDTDDEDGVTFRSPAGGGFDIHATVTGSNTNGNPAMLCGYLDGAADGVINGIFESSVDYAAGDAVVGLGSESAAAGNEEVCIQVPAIATPTDRYAIAQTNTDVSGPDEALGAPDDVAADVANGNILTLDLGVGVTIASSETFTLTLSGKTTGAPGGRGLGSATIDTSPDGSTWTAATPGSVTDPGQTLTDTNFTAGADARYVRITGTGDQIEVDALHYLEPGPIGGTSATYAAVSGFNGASAACEETAGDGTFTCTLIFVPNFTAAGTTYARFRLTTDAKFFSTSSPSPTGAASDGEVEDFELPFDPTAVSIGDVDLDSLSVEDYLDSATLDQLRALLRSFGVNPDGMDRAALIAALTEFLDPDGDGQVALFRWDTLEERGTIGFYVERQVQSDDQEDWIRINNDLLPGMITAPMGAEYRLLDPGAQPGTTYQYRMIELEATGNTREYGPYTLQME